MVEVTNEQKKYKTIFTDFKFLGEFAKGRSVPLKNISFRIHMKKTCGQ